MNKNPQYKKSGAMFMVGAFGVVILAISAVTTFSFFATYFASIFPTGMLGPELASLLAGGAGVILFDIASVYWLNTFLNHAETSEQRGIALLMLVVTFVGAAGASIAQLGLAASGDVALDPATRQSIANASVWTVIIGVVSNFGANIAYGRFSLASKQAVMEADRRDMVQNAEDEQARHLDSLIAQNVKELLTAEAPVMAQEQAQRLVTAYRSREMAKYAGNGPTKSNTQPTTPPAPVKTPIMRQPRPGGFRPVTARGFRGNGAAQPDQANNNAPKEKVDQNNNEAYYKVIGKRFAGGFDTMKGALPYNEAVDLGNDLLMMVDKYTDVILVDDTTGEPHPSTAETARRLGYINPNARPTTGGGRQFS